MPLEVCILQSAQISAKDVMVSKPWFSGSGAFPGRTEIITSRPENRWINFSFVKANQQQNDIAGWSSRNNKKKLQEEEFEDDGFAKWTLHKHMLCIIQQ